MLEKYKRHSNPIILFGTGRSGTTIFMNALFRHKDVAFYTNILERKPKWLWTSYLRRLTDNSYYRIFPDQVFTPLDKLFLKPVEGYAIWDHLVGEEVNFARSFLDNDIPSTELKNKVHSYIQALTENQKRTRFALKITGPGRLRFLTSLFPNAHFIWLKRDFISTLHSFLKVDFWQDRSRMMELWWKSSRVEKKLRDNPLLKEDAILFTAFQLQAIIFDIEQTIEEENIDVLQIDYESFVQNPEMFLREALKFCNLTPDQDCLKFIENTKIENRNKHHTDYFNKNKLLEIQDLRDSFYNNINS